MTIICALHEPGVGTWIGSDRARNDGDRLVIGADGKWVKRDGWAIGCTGNGRAKDAIALAATPPTAPDIEALAVWLRLAIEADGFKPGNADAEAKTFGTWFIVATPTSVWRVANCFAVTPLAPGFYADGSGLDLATGYAWRRDGKPQDIVRGAIECACLHNIRCGGEPWIELLRA